MTLDAEPEVLRAWGLYSAASPNRRSSSLDVPPRSDQ